MSRVPLLRKICALHRRYFQGMRREVPNLRLPPLYKELFSEESPDSVRPDPKTPHRFKNSPNTQGFPMASPNDIENYDTSGVLDTSSSGGGSIDDFDELDEVERAVELHIAAERVRNSPIRPFHEHPLSSITANNLVNGNHGRNTSGSSTATVDSGYAIGGIDADHAQLNCPNKIIPGTFDDDLNLKIVKISSGEHFQNSRLQHGQEANQALRSISNDSISPSRGFPTQGNSRTCVIPSPQGLNGNNDVYASEINGREEKPPKASSMPIDLTLVDPGAPELTST